MRIADGDNKNSDMMKQPDACVVRITDAEGNTLGSGFLVSTDGRIATCAHVVEGTELAVAFPGGEPRPAHVVTTDPIHDVAILRLAGELPPGAEPARLGRSAEGYYSDFRSRGYRPLGEMQGIPAEGRVLHAVSECPGVKHLPLILRSQDIRKGMSGAPVYVPELDLVVGMISGYWDSLKAQTGYRDAETGFAVPSEAVIALCSDIPMHQPSPRFQRPPMGIPFQAPAIPSHFIPRPEVSNEVKIHLLADVATAPGALVVSAVHGLGGIGKTTLVAALTHDPELQARFPEGILWTTLGQQPDVLSLLVGWIQALRDYDFRPIAIESATNHLHSLLHGKNCLLVVDDAWQAEHVRAFLVGGERCRVLVTTRDATLARKVGARLYDLDVMTEAQALALFEARLGPLDDHREQAVALAHELGHLPLALELAAAQVEGGVAWAELLETFRGELADLAALDLDEATFRNESLRLSFRLSLEQLSPDDQYAFAWLGVLPEDAQLNPMMAAVLWDELETEARRRLHRLRDKALVRTVGEERYTVHDLLHHECQLQLVKQIPLKEAHSSLLARYRTRTQYRLWHTLPDDGYIHQHLTWHMDQSGWHSELHNLLKEQMSDGRNGWYEARERLGQTSGYLSDVHRAWRQSMGQTCAGLECRYALIVTSLKSLAASIPPTLITALVENRVWSPLQGVAYARQIPEPRAQATALLGLVQHLPESLPTEALAAAQCIQDQLARVETFAKIAPHLSEPTKAETLTKALVTAREISFEQSRADALLAVAPHLPESLLDEAVAAARGMGERAARIRALGGLSCRLQGSLLEDVIVAERGIEGHWSRATVLAGLAPHLHEPLLSEMLAEALGAARQIGDAEFRIEALASVAAHLPQPLKAHVVGEALAAMQEVAADYSRARAIVRLAPCLPISLLGNALVEVQGIRDQVAQAKALAALTPLLPDRLLGDALAAIQAISDPRIQLNMFTEFAMQLAEPARSQVLPRALTALGRVELKRARARALARLASYLPAQLLGEALALVRSIEDERSRLRTSAHLATLLPGQMWREALAAFGDLKDPVTQVIFLAKLASNSTEPAKSRVLRHALAVVAFSGRPQAAALVTLLPHLPESLLHQALSMALKIKDQEAQLEVLAELAPRLSEPLQSQVMSHVLDAACRIRLEESRARLLVQLAPHIPASLLDHALAAARGLESKLTRADALMELSAYLTEPVKTRVLREASAGALEVESGIAQVRVLIQLSSLLSQQQRSRVLRQALAASLALQSEQIRAHMLAELAPHLPGSLVVEALAAVQRIENEQIRHSAVAQIIPHSPEQRLPEVLALATQIEDRVLRVTALAELASHLSKPAQDLVLSEALAAANEIHSEFPWKRAIALTRLVPYYPERLLTEALAAARVIQDRATRVEVLTDLASDLSGSAKDQVLGEALAAAREIEDSSAQVAALTHLASHLSEPVKAQALGWAMEEAAAIVSERDRASAMEKVLPQLLTLPIEIQVSFCQRALTTLATRTRPDLLSDLQALEPVLFTVGGSAAIAETFRAIQDVGRWWP